MGQNAPLITLTAFEDPWKQKVCFAAYMVVFLGFEGITSLVAGILFAGKMNLRSKMGMINVSDFVKVAPTA